MLTDSVVITFIYCFSFFWILPTPRSPFFPYTTLFRSSGSRAASSASSMNQRATSPASTATRSRHRRSRTRSEEHTSELQSRLHLVCRLLLDKNNRIPFFDRLAGQCLRHCLC